MTTKRAVLSAFVLALALGGSTAPSQANPPKPAFKEGEIIVKFKRPAADALEQQLARSAQPGNLRLSASLDQLGVHHGISAIQPLFKQFKAARQRTENLKRKDASLLTHDEKRLLQRLARAPGNVPVPELDRIYLITLAPGQSARAAVAAYRQDPAVEYAQLNHSISICLTPNDPGYPVQWPLNNTGQLYPASGEYRMPPGLGDKDVDAPESWDFYANSAEVVVAVIDTGVDYTHRDLQGNMWVNGAGQHGYDFVNDDGDPMDDNRHGTHCAGIIAARNNNGLDIAGVSWNAKIMAVKFLDEFGDGDDTDGVQAIAYAIENGADVLSNSWVSEDENGLIADAVMYAVSQGVIFVAAAGNGNSSAPYSIPAACDGVIAVAATDSADDRAPFSNYGSWVDIAAPGVDILSLRAAGAGGYLYPPDDPDASMLILSGTSMACPHVAGACAVLLSIDPSLSAEAVRTILMANADPLSDPAICASGRLNIDRAARHCASSRGSLYLDRTHYTCTDTVALRVTDRDLAGAGSCTASVTTAGTDSETVLLSEEGQDTGVFRGSIPIASGTPSAGDGTVQVATQTVITATYYDANDGTGSPASATDTAQAICTGIPLPDGHWWMLDETSGTVAHDFIDPSGAFDGAFNGTAPNWVAGVSGGAVDLDGVSEYFAVPALDNHYENNDTFTVAGWFNTAQSSGRQTIVGMWVNSFPNAYSYYFGWQVLVENGNVVARFGQFSSTTLEIAGTTGIADGQWHHFALTYPTKNAAATLYVDGQPEGTPGPKAFYLHPAWIARFRIGDGSCTTGTNTPVLKGGPFHGMIDDIILYQRVLTPEEIALLANQGVPSGKAANPNPANLAVNIDINPDLTWTAGDGATSHDLYFGAVNPPPFQGNQAGTTYHPGLLQNNTTYYWRIDEHNPGGTTTGDLWSFTTVPFLPGQASNPTPANGATNVTLNATLSWNAGSDATSHDVYFGTANPPLLVSGDQINTTYNPGTLNGNTTYYWRIDEKNAAGTTTGTVWSFTTTGAPPPPAYVGSGTVAASTGAITPGLPSGLVSGDILLLFVETANQAVSISNPNGGTWAAVASSPQLTGSANGSTGVRLTAFWSRYNGTQGAPRTSDSGNHQLGRIVAIRGAAASGNPWNVTAGGVEGAADTSGSIPGATTTVANTLVVAAIATALPDANGTSNFSGWSNASLASLTERTDNTTSQGNGGGLGIVSGTKAAAGAYGNTSVTCASSSYKAMLSIALKP